MCSLQMSKDSLMGLAGLVLLSLGGNRLQELPDLRPLKGLEVVKLQGNPLRCGCPLLPLRRWVLGRRRREAARIYDTVIL